MVDVYPNRLLSKHAFLSPVNQMSVCPTNSSPVNAFQPDEDAEES